MTAPKHKAPFCLASLAFVSTFVTCFLVTFSCNHTVTAFIAEVRPLEDDTCAMTLRYVVGDYAIYATQIKECFDVPTRATVGVCYNHWDHGTVFAHGSYVPFWAVATAIAASGAAWAATCVAFLRAETSGRAARTGHPLEKRW